MSHRKADEIRNTDIVKLAQINGVNLNCWLKFENNGISCIKEIQVCVKMPRFKLLD